MPDSAALAAVGGALATIAIVLAGLQHRSLRRLMQRAATAWAGIPLAVAVSVTGALAVAAFWLIAPGSSQDPVAQLLGQSEATSALASTDLLSVAPGSGVAIEATDANAQGGERRERALQSLRAYAAKIEGMREISGGLATHKDANDSALPDVDTMMERLRARLRENPTDMKGWMTLGWACANTGKYAEAVTAYEAALQLNPGNAEVMQALEESRRQAKP